MKSGRMLVVAAVVCAVLPSWCLAEAMTLPSDGKQIGKVAQGLAAPNYDWWYGCSPTSAGMMVGYYDRSGYGGLQYPDLVPGGVAEANTFGAPGALVNGVIASAQHIADYYPGGYGASGDDVGTHSPNCLADFMETSQDNDAGNSNGSTSFWFYSDGSRLTFSILAQAGNEAYFNSDGMCGVGEYVRYAGYDFYDPNPGNVADDMLYSQLTYDFFGGSGFANPFTFADFMAEIDAGRVVMVHVDGHSMLGYDYIEGENTDPDQVYVYDTWNDNDGSGPHTDGQNPGILDWNGSYGSMQMYAVTVLEPSGGIPEPTTMTLLGLGGMVLLLRFRRRRHPLS